ncbi:esterase-like activity of phytase family protein [Aureimonas frigidaquae]|uniref:Phytase-like domain-containing protein n=1 Tax=Aureimonas frigidaquae TaxID=424757 RepID=A0A0N7KXS9_9HYPH|nr:esterase-like activity of phytase family protein [Aureimonas frigidaquae]BAT27769.1 hypothetical protein [Aureimonas frigidaquae]
MLRAVAALAAIIACTAMAATGAAAPAGLSIDATPIMRFKAGSAETRFGMLEFRGGFSFRASDRRLQGVSSLRFTDRQGSRFLAVTDTGFWFEGAILRGPDGVPTGIGDARIAPILDAQGRPQPAKGDADAEGLAIGQDAILVAFERDHRVAVYDAQAPLTSPEGERLDIRIPLRELRRNAGLETIAIAPPDSRLAGAPVIVSEQSLDGKGDLFAAVLGPKGGIFTVAREAPWHVTDGAFLPDGDLVLLERRYEGLGRIGMRLRRIDGRTIAVGARVDGPVIMEADGRYEIDNMEALDIVRDAAGATILAIASDDNGSFFQRNLYLEFRLIDAP